mgnify:CR=1 FL=1|jgi:hypothetical protein
MSYFICRRAFRDAKGPVSTGTVINPVEIKRFRFRLQEGHIVEVTEQNFEQYATLFRQRYGINIPKLDKIPSKESEEEKELLVKRVEESGPDELTFEKAEEEAKVVPVAKATAKAKVTKNE